MAIKVRIKVNVENDDADATHYPAATSSDYGFERDWHYYVTTQETLDNTLTSPKYTSAAVEDFTVIGTDNKPTAPA